MKKLLIIIALILTPVISSAQITSATLQASGLTCSMCSNAVFKSLNTVPFVESVDSDVETSTFIIKLRSGEIIDPAALYKAVEKAGFSISNLTLKVKVNSLKVKNNARVAFGGISYNLVDVKERIVDGEVNFRLLDKNFVSPKEFKKIKSKLTSSKTDRVYNVTI